MLNPELKDIPPKQVVTQRVQLASADISTELANIYGTLMGHLGLHGGAVLEGAPFARWHSYDPTPEGLSDMEAGFHISGSMPAAEGILSYDLPAQKAYKVEYTGPYVEMFRTWDAFRAWMQEQGHQASGPSWEEYITDPGLEPDPQKWLTFLYIPV